MRFFLFLAMLPLPTLADTFDVQAPPRAVTIYGQGAVVSRTAEIELPAGQHDLLLKDLDPDLWLPGVSIDLSGASIVSQSWTPRPDDPYRAPRTPEWLAAKAAVDTAAADLAALDDKISLALASGQAAQDQIDFLNGLAGPKDGVVDVDTLRAIGQLIASDGAAARAAFQLAEAEARQLRLGRPDLEFALTRAQALLADVTPTNTAPGLLTLNVQVPQNVTATLDMSYITSEASWAPVYDIDLVGDTQVVINRSAIIEQYSNEDWSDIALTLSTLSPFEQSGPGILRTQRRRIVDPAPQPQLRALSRAQSDSAMGIAEPIIEAPVIVEESAASASFEGIGVSYTLPEPVSIKAQSADLLIALDTLSTTAKVSARGIPRHDDTAFRLAHVTNTTSEILLPGDTFLSVDGQLVGETYVEALPPNADMDIFFGRIDGLRLKRTILDRNEGDRGLISRSNEKTETVRIEVENLTNRDWDVSVWDAVPFSEQDDLSIEWQASPVPTTTDVDDRRGILEWELAVKGGQTQTITIDTQLNWPEGKILR